MRDAVELLSDVSTELFIGGRWRAAKSGARFDVVDPATGVVLATVADGDVGDALAAVDAAAVAADGWAATAPRQRGEILRRAFELMTARGEDLARLISLENGKALVDARGEVAYAAEFFPAPFGGVKQSGLGREGGHDGMLDYLESKYIAVQW